jgi:NADH dehydrogenase
MFLHLMLILSVRNKLLVFINWAWSYFTKDSSLRLIISSRSHHDFNKQELGYKTPEKKDETTVIKASVN